MKPNILSLYENCTLCPRSCSINRTKGFGFCKESNIPNIVWIGLHKGEEAPISGENGSGMFFFRGCTLGCPTCQNIQISSSKEKANFGKNYSEEKIAENMLSLEKMGATTISFVTAEHFAPSVVKAIELAHTQGLKIPTVFNTSGFMSIDTIKLLLPYIDIWLWDTKTLSPSMGKEFFGSEDYAKVEEEALSFLSSNVNSEKLDSSYPRGIIVRHLVLPSHIAESEEVIKNFAKKYKNKCYFSLMYQFIPPKNASDKFKKTLTKEDTDCLENLIFDEGIENGYIQELSENEEVWRPDFKRKNPFPSHFAKSLF